MMVEGNSAATNADPLVYDMMAAFYTACSSFIAQNYGARKRDDTELSVAVADGNKVVRITVPTPEERAYVRLLIDTMR